MNNNLKNDTNFLVIKTYEDLKDDKLIDWCKGAWKIKPNKLDEIDYLIAIYHKKVIGSYTINDVFSYDRRKKRIFDLNLNKIDLGLIGKKIDYNIINPATTINFKHFKALEKQYKKSPHSKK